MRSETGILLVLWNFPQSGQMTQAPCTQTNWIRWQHYLHPTQLSDVIWFLAHGGCHLSIQSHFTVIEVCIGANVVAIVWPFNLNLAEIPPLSGQSPGTSSTGPDSTFLHPWWCKWLREVSDNQADHFLPLPVPVNWAATWQCHYLQLPPLNQTLKYLSDYSHSSQVSPFFPRRFLLFLLFGRNR